MYGKKIFGLFLFGLLLLSIGLYLGQTSLQNQIQPQPLSSITPIQVQSPTLVQISTSSSSVLGNEEQRFKVLRVVDGDTIEVEINGQKERVRLVGIDTPEIVDPRKPVQCFGKEASNKAKEVLEGKFIFLEKDDTQGERDRYQRLLRYVFLEDGTNFNKLMINEGFAFEYTYKIPYKYQSQFKQAEKEAREAKRGLWSDNGCFLD